MTKRIFVWVMCVAAAAMFGSAQAAETTLDNAAVQKLLAGNTAYGVHYGKRTAQYFSESGLTLWQGEGDPAPAEGQWKVEDGKYCSRWGSDWGCLNIAHDEEQNVYYFIGDDFRAPFVVKNGYALSF
ncbi:MAG: hypothetical protein ACNYPH_02500 [Gammaproteobacteria bacterium WSBS_2016_MAG_OTU1]